MKFMLDTNICIYIIKKHPPSVIKKFLNISPLDVCISSITFAELEFGVQKSQQIEKNKQALEKFLLPLEIAAFDQRAAVHYGTIRHALEKKGNVIGPLDLFIAAHAQQIGATLITNNQKEFARIPNLKIENWIET